MPSYDSHMDSALDSHAGIPDAELRRNNAGTQSHLNRSRNNADARYHAAVKLKEKVAEYAKPCSECGVEVIEALTEGKLRDVTLETAPVFEGSRYTVRYKRGGFRHFIASHVDRFDDERAGVGYRYHDCKGGK